MKKIIAILLALTVSLSLFAGCKKEETTKIPDRLEDIVLEELSDVYLVNKAKTDYQIVVSKDAGQDLLAAVRELKFFFKEATSVTLPVVYDDEVSYDENSTFISLGENKISEKANVSIKDKNVKKEGFLISTVGKSIFIIGGAEIGTVYGVYGFLNREFNYEFYFTNTYTLDTGVLEKKLKVYPEIIENPDIDTLQVNYGFISETSDNSYRFRMSARADSVLSVGDTLTIHNILRILPPKDYPTHSAWYSADNLCFTASGNADEYKAMITAAKEQSIKAIKKSDALNICIGQPDLVQFCGCEHCSKFASENGGANSSVMIRFCNDLADAIYEWFATSEGSEYERDLSVYFLAYQSTLQSPTKLNDKTGEYELDGIRCNEHVGVYFAADNYNFTADINDESNATYYAAMKSWKAVANKFQFWFYDTNFKTFLVPYDTLQGKVELYRFANDMGATSIFDEAQRDQLGSAPAWSNLKAYLESKLRWNVNSDVNELTRNFFKACYGTASDLMFENYLEFRTQYQKIIAKIANGEISEKVNNVQSGLVSRNLWEKTLLEKWLDNCNKAFESIEYLKDENVEKYNTTKKLISSERISAVYLILNIYENDYTADELKKFTEYFKQDLLNTGMLYEGSDKTFDEFNSKWGISIS